MSVNIQMADGTLRRVASMNGTDQQQAALQIDNFLSLQSPRPVENRVVTENLSILQDNFFVLMEMVQDLQVDVADLESAMNTGSIDTAIYTSSDEILVTTDDEYITFIEAIQVPSSTL